MKKYIGLDVHKASTTYVVLDGKGKVIMKGTMKTEGKALRRFIASIEGPKELVLEEGTMSAWLAQLLRPVVDHLVICDPTRNAKLFKDKKSDELDAKRLAELLRMGALKAIYHPIHPIDALRSPLRTYVELNQETTRLKNRIKAAYRARGIETDADVYTLEERSVFLEKMDLDGEKERLGWLYDRLDFLEAQKQDVRDRLVKASKKQKGYRYLTSIPGIGPIHASMLLGFVITPERFRTKRQFWSYCGLAVNKRSSADWVDGPSGLEKKRRERTLGLNRHRHPLLKSVFKQATLSAIRGKPFGSLYDKEVKKGRSPALARVIVARKLAAVTLRIWKENVAFDPEFIVV